MSRSLSASVLAAVTSSSVRPILLYEGTWATSTARFWTGLGDLSWNGQTWTGVGNLVGVSEITETAETRVEGVELSLSGVPTAELTRALGAARQGLPCTIYFGVMESDGTVTADTQFVGRMDTVRFAEDGTSATITVRYLSRLADMRKANGRRYDDEDLKAEYAGDKGLEYIASIQDVSIVFGGGWRWPS